MTAVSPDPLSRALGCDVVSGHAFLPSPIGIALLIGDSFIKRTYTCERRLYFEGE